MGESVYFCPMCGFTSEQLRGCPACEEPLMELNSELEAEFQRNAVMRQSVSMMQDKKWY